MASETLVSSNLAGRYARALFELADGDKILDKIDEDLKEINYSLGDSADLTKLISSPVISRDNQLKAMIVVLENMDVSELTKKFIGVVAENRRLKDLPDIIKNFQTRLAERKGEITAEVVASRGLSDVQINEIRDVLGNVTGKSVFIEKIVDEDILGGLIVKVGSQMIDSSLRTKINKLRFAMKGIG